MKIMHTCACMVMIGGILLGTGGIGQAQLGGGTSPGGTGSGSGVPRKAAVEWEPWTKGENRRDRWGKKAPTCRNPCQVGIQQWEDPVDRPSRVEAIRRFLAAAEWDQDVELAAWVHPAGRVHPVVWDQAEVWDQREVAGDRR